MGNTLVTGAHGLLGSWLTKRLVDDGRPVVALERDHNAQSALTKMGLLDRVITVQGDVCDGALLRRVISEYEIETIFHLAAQTIVGTAQRSPLPTFEANVRGTWEVLEAARLGDVKATVVASSDKAYGQQDQLPYTEDAPLLATQPYEASKAAAEMITRSFWNAFGLPVAITRCANLYGGGDLNGSRLVPEAVSSALAGRAPVIRSDGSPERDFLYVEDATDAYVQLADAVRQGKGLGEAFNVGWGKPFSVSEVVALICDLVGTGVEPDIQGTGTPDGEIDRQYVDPSRFRDLTGWVPSFPLREGLNATIKWSRDYDG